jgi:hypothetical protein
MKLKAHEDTLEDIIDRHGLAGTLTMIYSVIFDKVEHIRSSYDDEESARAWERAGRVIAKASATDAVGAISP